MHLLRTFLLLGTALAALTGCQTIAGRFNSPDLPDKGKLDEANQAGLLFTKQQLFVNAAIAAQAAPTDAAKLRNYFETGVLLSDAICNNWFATHFKADRETNHTKGLANIVGSTAIGVLGFTGAESKQLGIFGLGMAGMNAEFENYMAFYLLSPAIPQIRKKINEGREAYANRIRAVFSTATELSFPVVQQALAGYHELCSRIEIQRVVTESVQLAQYTVPDLGAAEKRHRITSGRLELHEILADGQRGSLSADEVTALYVADNARLGLPADATERQELLKARYTENPLYKSWIDRLTAVRADTSSDGKAKNDRLSRTLAAVGELVGGVAAWQDLAGPGDGKRLMPGAGPKAAPGADAAEVARVIGEKPQIVPRDGE